MDIKIENVNNEELRRTWAIFVFLSGHRFKQKDLKYILSSFFPEDISDEQLSTVLKHLEQDNLIERESVRKQGRWANPTKSWIKQDYNSFISILREIYDIKHVFVSTILKKRFIKSEFAEKFINKNLILNLENLLEEEIKLQNPLNEKIKIQNHFFTEAEKEILLDIFKLSPSSLYHAIFFYKEELSKFLKTEEWDSYKSQLKENEYTEELKNEFKKYFIFSLQLKAGEDISNDIIKRTKDVEYTIKLKFVPLVKSNFYEKTIKQEIEEDTLKSTMTTKST